MCPKWCRGRTSARMQRAIERDVGGVGEDEGGAERDGADTVRDDVGAATDDAERLAAGGLAVVEEGELA